MPKSTLALKSITNVAVRQPEIQKPQQSSDPDTSKIQKNTNIIAFDADLDATLPDIPVMWDKSTCC